MDFLKIKQELEQSSKGKALDELANSKDGQKLSKMLDQNKVESAVKNNDTKAIQDILKQVLSTDEGKRLTQKLSETMK